ncbi:MAG: hypothetical protein N3F10_04455 [Candidatus Bathyarchaeota archaeon]|nr:hypothetical protein [Candidatus Bathyarchaeota archaeon]MCS7113910.1 hypothetical protein [Candidatus Bathyarchaeota archaeon]MCX8177533.1 hypothetical protein [Candidatus Bathyarchaeota archaeon]
MKTTLQWKFCLGDAVDCIKTKNGRRGYIGNSCRHLGHLAYPQCTVEGQPEQANTLP